MKITQTPTTDLIPYVNNAKIHSDAQIDHVAASIKEFGFRVPIIIDSENVVVAGHCRLLAAKKLNLTKVPTTSAADLTPAQIRAYRLTDNRSAEKGAEWDYELVSAEIDLLLEEDFDIDLTGFDEDVLSSSGGSDPTDNIDDDYQENYAVLVECESEREQEKIFNDLEQSGYKCKVLVN